MEEWATVFLCMAEMFLIMLLCFTIPFSLLGLGYPLLYSPSFGIVSILGVGLLGGDLVARACDGVGFSW